MSKLFYITFMLLLCLVSFNAHSKNDVPIEIQKKLNESMSLNSTAQGYEFYVAIPPNEQTDYPYGTLEIYVTSLKPTEVTLQIGSTNSTISKKMIKVPMGIVVFSSNTGEIDFRANEVRTPETVLDMGLRIVSDRNPISVYVLNAKNTTSDGYMAIPTSSWGTDYIHIGYYDNHEGHDNMMNSDYFGSGFIVVASEDDTRVNIDLKGVGSEFAGTTTGKKIGESIVVVLDKGQVYLVQGDGKTDGAFDLTGSRITSDKPIGMVSYHQRCDIPAFLNSSRNHLSEMIPPVQSWGKTYATVELQRNNKGDLFRVVASEPNTKWELVWYDMKTDQVIGRRDGNFKKSGDFAEVLELLHSPGPKTESVRGVAVFKANKPIFVMHYAYSSSWDAASMYDPFMVCVTSVEQFTNYTIFQTPNMQFSVNNFNLIAVGDTSNPQKHVELLKSIKIDEDFVYIKAPQFLQSRIPGTNLFWARLQVIAGSHYISGNTPFGGYVYGFTSVDGYGWPAAMQVKLLSQIDSLPPVVTYEGSCGEYDVKYTELRDGNKGDDPLQKDLGVSEKPTLLNLSYNFDEPDFNFGFVHYPPNYDAAFKLRVTDLTKDALAVFSVTDRAGNITVKEISYKGAQLALDPALVDFDTVRVNTKEDYLAMLRNTGTTSAEILSIGFKKGSVFSLAEKPKLPIEIKNGESLELNIRYSPTKESLSALQFDIDSIIISTECSSFSFAVKGRGVLPKIQVADWDAGQLVVGEDKYLTGGLEIKNTGSQTLVVTGFDWDPSDNAFTVKNIYDPTVETDPKFPIVIDAGKSVKLSYINFKPLVENPIFTATMKFKSNAESGDSLGVLTGRSVQPGPQITSFDWERRRVIEANTQGYYPGFVTISNSGTSSIKLRDVKLMVNATTRYTGNDYKIIDIKSENTSEELPSDGLIEIFPATDSNPHHCKSVRVNLLFSPKSEAPDKKIEVHANFDAIAQGSVFGYLQGDAYLPKIVADGYVFAPPAEVGFQHADKGFVTIQSTSQTADLFIKEIRIVDDIVPNSKTDFDLNGGLTAELVKYKNYTLAIGKAIAIPVNFKPTRTGRRAVHLAIISDAYMALDSIQTTSVVVEGVGYDQSFEATDIDFGRINRCESPIRTFVVRNTGTSNTMKLKSMKVDNANKDIFIIEDFTPDEEIQPQQEKTYHVRFDPTARQGQIQDENGNNVVAEITIETEIGSKTMKVEGKCTKSLVKLSQSNIEKMSAGMTTTSQYEEFPVLIDLVSNASFSGDWSDTKITSFTMEIKYNPVWMKYNGSVTAGDVINGWTLSGKETIHSETSATLTITGSGTNPISGSGKLFNPNFLILLSDSVKFTPKFGNISFDSRDICVETIDEPGSISLEHCVQDLRNVVINRTQFNMAPISPNPVTASSVDLNFSIGLDNIHTKIEIVNSMGEVVRTLQDGEMNAGAYQATILTNELGSGVYFINMVSGPYTAKEKLVIVK